MGPDERRRRVDDALFGVWGSRSRVRARIGTAIGLLFLAGAVHDLATSTLPAWRLALVCACFTGFVALYLSLLPPARSFIRDLRFIVLGIAGLATLAILTLALGGPRSCAALFVYLVAAAGMLLPLRPALLVIAVTATGVGIAAGAMGTGSSAAGSLVLSIVAIGLMMGAFGRQIRTNQDLRSAREELAGMAVAEERLRIARDLHDLLGHSLSIVALKTELASKLLARDAERAAAELADVQDVTRRALAEVREAVQGYRRLALRDAVDGARTALSAAGIHFVLDEGPVDLPAEVESTLAWALREATTNVVRHSGARNCEIHVRSDGDFAEVEVVDDGRVAGSQPVRTGRGSGLVGLAERAERIRGSLVAGPRPEGGFRLRLSVPLDPQPAA
jgi:two-component system sensor histidine kinase DesK